jgi:hypothetical protein
MVKKCREEGCTKQPRFNYKENKSPIYCHLHKKDEMIDVVNYRCQQEGCDLLPAYNYEGSKRGIYCNTHKKDGMIHIFAKRCQEEGCKKIGYYKYEGTGLLYCITHRQKSMINIYARICKEVGCNIYASYNYKGKTIVEYCAKHKKDGMIGINYKICKTPYCETQVGKKYDGYCLTCFVHHFPDRPNSRNYKTKEKTTIDYVLEKFPDFSWAADKKVQDGCSRKRPDLLLDLGYQVIIVEIDENQHQDYDCSCENKRLMLLSQDVGYRPLIFIRFNPDDYLTSDKKVTSCWGIDGRGICVVKKSKKTEWNERLEVLRAQIDYWIQTENKTEKTVEIIQLFYDCE